MKQGTVEFLKHDDYMTPKYAWENIKQYIPKHKILWEATEEGLNKLKPGSTCSEVSEAMLNVLKKSGLKSNSVGRMGHGLGLQVTEPPSICPDDKTILKENMIITIEPCFEYSHKKMLVHEENILITNDGYELLTSRTKSDIPIIT